MVMGGSIAVIAVVGVILCVCMKRGGKSSSSRSLPKGKRGDRYDSEDVFYYSSESSGSEDSDKEEEDESERRRLRS